MLVVNTKNIFFYFPEEKKSFSESKCVISFVLRVTAFICVNIGFDSPHNMLFFVFNGVY